MLDVFVRCGDHAPFYNLFNVILKNLGMFNVNSFCHLHSFFARYFYLIVKFFFVLRKQKRNKLPTTSNYHNITPMQFNAKILRVVSHFFQNRIWMTFDHASKFFLLIVRSSAKIILKQTLSSIQKSVCLQHSCCALSNFDKPR